jgi:hypothetical protein
LTETIKEFGLGLAKQYHLQNVLAICEQVLVSEQVQPYTAGDLAIGFSLIAEAQAKRLEEYEKELEASPEVGKPGRKSKN